MTECIQGWLAFAGVITLTEVVVGEGSAFRAGTVAISSSSASLWQVREEKGCVTMQLAHRMDRSYIELSSLVPPQDLHVVVGQFWAGRTTREAETFVPNLDWSFDAPTTAKLEEDRNFFLISCVMTISGVR